MAGNGKAVTVLVLNTLAFTVCFACWMLNGVLITFFSENQLFHFTDSQIGWLIGVPVLSGSLIRLPVGMPRIYAAGLVAMAVVFSLLAWPKKFDDTHINGLWQRLEPLRYPRVWRFGLYYLLVFGGFVALSQWPIPYYVSV